MFDASFKRSLLLRTSLLATIGGLSFAGAASAQQAPPADTPAGGEVVVVTGSRIARQDYVANSPIVTVGQEELAQIGSASVDTLINQMPQFTAAVTSTSNNPGGSGQANISLRGLGTNRTLILLDGQRLVPSNRDGTVDVNNVPAALVENVEVVTGGQSAVYGSDALAGVVNFKLKKHFEGIEVNGLYGINDAGDGAEKSTSITLGGNFAENKGNAVVAFTYANRESIFNKSRDFSSISGPSGTTPYGQVDGSGFTLAATNTLLAKYGAAANAAAQQNWGFNADGTLFTGGVANAKNYRGDTTSIDFKTIPTLGTYNTGPLNELQVPLDRYTMFGKLSYDFNQYFHAAIDANFVNYTSQAILAPSPGSGNPGTGTFPGTGGTGFLVAADNPFISADLRTLLNSRTDPAAPFLIRARTSNVGPRLSRSEYTVYQIGLDLGGDLGIGDLTWNLYSSYGRQQRIETQTGNVSHAALRQLLEAVDGGASLCTGGYNFQNPAAVSASCINYISRTTKNQSEYEQRNIVADIQGSLFQLPAGPVQFDIGADYRADEAFFVPDSVLSVPDVSRTVDRTGHTLVNNAPGVVGFNGQGAVNGFIDVKEAFGEILVPILKDVFLVKSLNLDASYRYSDYNTIGGVDTYKVGGDWSPIDMLKVRGGYSRAVRAPSISELFAPAANNFPAIGSPSATSTAGDPCDTRSSYRLGSSAAAVRTLCIAQGVPAGVVDTFTYGNTQGQAIIGGNTNLAEETADTYTIGFVLEPKFDVPFLRDISLSVDHYDIKIANFISAPDEPTFLKRCFNAQGDNPSFANSSLFCAPINRDPTSGQLTGFNAQNANLSKVQTTGTDFQFDWRVGLDEFGLSSALGSLTLNVQGTHLESFEVAALPGDAAIDFAGTIGNTFVSSVEVSHPDWKFTSNLLYSVGPFQVGFRWRDIAKMDGTGGLAGLTAKKKDYYDLTARYDLTDNLQLRASVLNLTNVAPAYLPPGIQANTDPGTYDVAGRRYTISLSAKY